MVEAAAAAAVVALRVGAGVVVAVSRTIDAQAGIEPFLPESFGILLPTLCRVATRIGSAGETRT